LPMMLGRPQVSETMTKTATVANNTKMRWHCGGGRSSTPLKSANSPAAHDIEVRGGPWPPQPTSPAATSPAARASSPAAAHTDNARRQLNTCWTALIARALIMPLRAVSIPHSSPSESAPQPQPKPPYINRGGSYRSSSSPDMANTQRGQDISPSWAAGSQGVHDPPAYRGGGGGPLSLSPHGQTTGPAVSVPPAPTVSPILSTPPMPAWVPVTQSVSDESPSLCPSEISRWYVNLLFRHRSKRILDT
jgi:hypothetical protein